MRASKYFFLFFLVLLLLTFQVSANKPSEFYTPEPNITVINGDDFIEGSFLISAYQDGKKLKKSEIDWFKLLNQESSIVYGFEYIDGLKYDKNGKLKKPLNNITFRIEPSFIQNKECSGNQYYTSCIWDETTFDSFKSKNIITNQTITPIYYGSSWDAFWEIFMSKEWGTFTEFQTFMTTPYAYDITFIGIINDLDPEINQVFTTSSDIIFPNQTEGTTHGASLIYNGTAQTGYNSSIGDFRSLVFFNSTSTFWNLTLNIADTFSTRSGVVDDYGINLSEPSLVAYWALDGDVLDRTGNNDGTCTNCPLNATGLSSGAMDFDGASDVINVIEGTGFNITSALTISAWISPEDDGYNSILHRGASATQLDTSYSFFHSLTDTELSFHDGTAWRTSSGANIPLNEWTYVTVTYGSSSTTFYKNGEQIGSSIASGASLDNIIGSKTYIGSQLTANYFQGDLDEVIIFNKSLSPTEIQDIYKAGLSQHADTNITVETRTATSYNLTDSSLVSFWALNNDTALLENGTTVVDSTGRNNGTIVSNPPWAEANGVVGGGMDFDGVADYINIPDDSSLKFTGDYTVASWIRWDGNNAGTAYVPIIYKGVDSSEYNYALGIRKLGSGDERLFGYYDNTIAFEGAEIVSTFTANTWYHVAMVYDGSSVRVYKDGSDIGGDNSIGAAPTTTTDPVFIGKGTIIAEEEWSGAVDEVRIYNRSLSAAEISDLYNLGQTHILWNDWTLKETAQDAQDIQSKQSGNFMQFRANFNSNNTLVSPYLFNHSVQSGQNPFPTINFTFPTLEDGNISNNNFIEINVSSSDSELHSVTVDFNKTLQGWWRLENHNSSTVIDNSSYGNDGLIIGATPTANGKLGGAYEFDGIDDYITIPQLTLNGSDGATLSFWAKETQISNVLGIFGIGSTKDYILADSDQNRFFVEFSSTGTNEFLDYTGITITDWNHYVFTFADEDTTNHNISLTINGQLQDSELYVADVLHIKYFANGYLTSNRWNGTLDDVQIYNRTLNIDEINSLYNATQTQYYKNFSSLGAGNYSIQAYAQDLTGQVNQTETRYITLVSTVPTPSVIVNTSMLGVKFNLSDFTYDSSTYIEQGRFTFNTSKPNENFVIITSLNVENIPSGTGTSFPFLNISIDNRQIVEQELSTITWQGNSLDVKSTGTPPRNFSIVSSGQHNITFKWLRIGNKPVKVSNIDISLGKLETEQNGTVNFTIESISATVSSQTFSKIQNISSINNPGINSTNYHMSYLSISATGQTNVICRFNQDDNFFSPFMVRTIPDSSTTGTMAMPFFSEISAAHNSSLECLSTTGETVTITGEFLQFELLDNNTNTIQGFQSSNTNTNWTSTITLDAGLNLLTNATFEFADGGNSIFIGASVSFDSNTGDVTPEFILNSTLIGDCITTKRRTSDGDIGNVFIYKVCKDSPTKGDSHNITFFVDIPAGEQLQIYDESLSGFETSSFDTSTANTPPIVALLNPSENQTINGTNQIINFTITDTQLDSYLTNITVFNDTSSTIVATNMQTNNLTAYFNTELFRNGWWNITVNATENETNDLFSGFDTNDILISNDNGSLVLIEPKGDYPGKDSILLNFSTNKQMLLCKYSLNGNANQSVTCSGLSTNTTFNGAIEGMNDFVLNVETGAGWLVNITKFDVNTQNISTLLVFPTESEYEENEAVTITSYCKFTNRTVCGSDVVCRLTSHYPNGSLLLENQFMSYGAGGVYTYSIGYTNGTLLNARGAYSSVVACYDGADQEAAFTWWVLTEKNQYVFLYSLLFLTAILLIIFGEWRKQWTLKYLGGTLMTFIGVWIFIYGIPGHSLSYLSSGNSDAWISWVSWIIIGFGFLYFFKAVYEDALDVSKNDLGGEE